MDSNPTGVLLLAFGGADSPEAIEPFMKNLMGGRVPPPALVEKIKARYGLIGGKSPLPEITAAQAVKLQKQLSSEGNFRVAVGMRYWRPFIKDGLDELLAHGVKKIVALSLAPFYSQVSTGAYKEELDRVIATMGQDAPQVVMAGPIYNNPLFLEAVAEKVADGLALIPEERRKNVPVIFSAHSLPINYVQNGDPYVEQFTFTVRSVVEKLQIANWYIAYQSKGGGQGEWLGPMVEEVMEQVKAQGAAEVLVVPAGFVSDHIETLYDVDVAQKGYSVSVGLNFHRTASLNLSPVFIKAMADTVLREML